MSFPRKRESIKRTVDPRFHGDDNRSKDVIDSSLQDFLEGFSISLLDF